MVPGLAHIVDDVARNVVNQMSPLEIGLMVHPHATPVKLKHVPVGVMKDHLTRYTKAELKRGQFFRVGERFTFFMDHKAKSKRSSAMPEASLDDLREGRGGATK
jgi:hypothetical protein